LVVPFVTVPLRVRAETPAVQGVTKEQIVRMKTESFPGEII
jgi:hypothetical protein